MLRHHNTNRYSPNRYPAERQPGPRWIGRTWSPSHLGCLGAAKDWLEQVDIGIGFWCRRIPCSRTECSLGKRIVNLRDLGSGQRMDLKGLDCFRVSFRYNSCRHLLPLHSEPRTNSASTSGRSAIDDIPNSLSRRLEPKTSDFRDAQSFPLQRLECQTRSHEVQAGPFPYCH